jgi:predicted lipid carrier protein YhbT
MNNAAPTISAPHALPMPFSLPLSLIPTGINSTVLANVLNRIFAPELADGELDFLESRIMLVRVEDARLTYRLTLEGNRIKSAANDKPHDLSIEGTIYDFLLLATRREDADTLFFNRRLKLGGDTELGLYVKNFLDSVELDNRLGPLQKVLNGTTNLIAKLP